MKKSILFVLFMSFTMLSHAQQITKCENPKGYAYFHDAASLQKKDSGWEEDAITGGVTTLQKLGAGNYDIWLVDSRSKVISLRQDGGDVLLVRKGQKDATFVHLQPGMRLQPGGWAHFKKFSTIANNPEFTRVIIVARFDTRVPDDPNELPSANYLMVGFYDLLEGYKATPNATDCVIFQLLGSGEDYVVTSVSPETPHVSPRSAIACSQNAMFGASICTNYRGLFW